MKLEFLLFFFNLLIMELSTIGMIDNTETDEYFQLCITIFSLTETLFYKGLSWQSYPPEWGGVAQSVERVSPA